MQGGFPVPGVQPTVALMRKGFQPLGEADQTIEVAPDGWFEATNLIGEYGVRVDRPQGWIVRSVRRRGVRLPNDRLIVGNAEVIDEIEILIGERRNR